MIDLKKYSLGELEVIYNDSYPKVQQCVLESLTQNKRPDELIRGGMIFRILKNE